MMAVYKNHLSISQLLIKRGANVNIQNNKG